MDRLVTDFALSPQVRIASIDGEQWFHIHISASVFRLCPAAQQADRRKGGLLCLAAAAVGLEEQHNALLAKIVPPVLDSFTDQDGRVRYYACEVIATVSLPYHDQRPLIVNEKMLLPSSCIVRCLHAACVQQHG